MVDTVRNFFGSPAFAALLDLPWMPVFFAFVFFLHPYLGALTLGGAVVLTLLTVLTELMTRRANRDASRAAAVRSSVADTFSAGPGTASEIEPQMSIPVEASVGDGMH
jgi:ATP-binding cassette subfamily C protein